MKRIANFRSGQPAAILFAAAMLVGIAVSKLRNAGVMRVASAMMARRRLHESITHSNRFGPARSPSYVDRQATKIVSGDRIEVKGSRVTIEGQPVIVAAEIRKGEQKLLRHDHGGAIMRRDFDHAEDTKPVRPSGGQFKLLLKPGHIARSAATSGPLPAAGGTTGQRMSAFRNSDGKVDIVADHPGCKLRTGRLPGVMATQIRTES